MTRQVFINVTQDDIDKGERSDSCKCPIALSLKRGLPLCPLEVCESFIYFEDAGIRWCCTAVPDSVLLFIDRFDNGAPVAPFSCLAEFFQKDTIFPTRLTNIVPT